MPQSTIYLVRHGRTALNAAGVLRGHLDEPLDEVGKREVQHLGEQFSRIAIDHVVCSPLTRARQTAQAIASPHALPITVEPTLIDRDYGRWAGIARAKVERQFGELDAAPGVERWASLSVRILSAFQRLLTRFEPATLIIVGHDATNRALLYGLLPGRWPNPGDIPQPTACWSRLERFEDRWAAPVVGAGSDSDPTTV